MIAAMLAIPLVRYTISPALKRRKPVWTDIGSAEVLQPATPTELELVLSIKDGWHETRLKKAVWAVKDHDGKIIVYSPICTHLGCGYLWEGSKASFHCPCHDSFFALDGQVLSGPAPRALDRLPVKVKRGRILVLYKEFKAGTSQKIAL